MKQPRTLLQQLIRERNWRVRDALAAFRAVRLEGETREFALSERQFARWIGGQVSDPQPLACRVAERVFGLPIRELLGPPRPGGLAPEGAPSWRGGRSTHRHCAHSERDWVTMTAHESGEHAADHGSQTVPGEAIAQFRDDVVRLARDYATTTPLQIHQDAVRVRDRAYAMLDRTKAGAQITELHLIVGQLCGILSSASFDLGYWAPASEQARAAFTYGELAQHNGLRAWARGIQAQMAFWTGRPTDAVALAQTAQQYAAPGTARLRLHSLEARAWAHLGAVTETTHAVEASEAERASADGRDELHDQIGGEFGFSPARQAMCNGSAFLQVRHAAAAAIQSERVIALAVGNGAGADDPVLACARADLALANLMRRDFDAAAAALTPLFAITAGQRRRGLMERLTTVRHALATPQWRPLAPARNLGRTIEDFAAVSAGSGLPQLPGPA
jgi:hypothetical protein